MSGERPKADLDDVTAERDRAIAELEATRRSAARQRMRFDERLEEDERLRRELGIAERERDRLHADLERLRANPVVRAGLWARRLVRRSRMAASPPPTRVTPGAEPPPSRPTTPAPFRAAFLDALAPGPARAPAGDPARIAVMGAGDARLTRLVRGFEALGLIARTPRVPIDGLTNDDVAVLTSPGVSRRRIPGHVVTVAVVGGDLDAWLADAAFDDIDVVIATTRDLAERVTRDTVHVPVETAGDPDAEAIVDTLRAWAARPRMAIHIGPLTWERAAGWGDLPFGRGLQRALARRGWASTLHVYEDRDGAAARRADVALHVFGARAPEPRDGQPTMLWVISHPDRISTRFADRYPVVFAGSDLFAALLAERTTARVVPLHQATDPDRFHPEPGGPPHEILFVGSSRGFRRRILADLAGTSHEVAVYGGGWTEELLAPHRLTGEWIPNDRLRRWYSAAGIVLCDHYDEMRDEGFISNRAYDALASGAFVISDRVPGIEAEFGQGLVTYGDPAELQSLVDTYLADPERRRREAGIGRQTVLARHTFAHRVATILAEVDRLRAGPGSGPG
jgi:glycosyltransferase involved in cell wall biosynthesis